MMRSVKVTWSLTKQLRHLQVNVSVQRRSFLTAPFPELSSFPSDLKDRASLHRFSIENNALFWRTVAKQRIQWIEDFKQVNNGHKFDQPDFNMKWFVGGKLNVSVNCVDRHYLNNPAKVALIWERDEPGTEEYVTYEQLYHSMNQFANMLKAHGVGKGTRVAIYMPTSPMTVVAMLACARIGAIHSVVFAGFSAESLASRINDSQCSVVITANEGVRGGKKIPLKQTVDAAVTNCPSIKHVLVTRRTDTPFKITPKDVIIDDKLKTYPTECVPEIMDANEPLFMLYTSGSTGKPKGLIHNQAGYLVSVALTYQLVFNLQPNDIFGCLADVGWITGHSYIVYGPLCNGGTSVLFESTPTYPDPGRYWETIHRLKINFLYAAPTSLRVLIKYGDDWVYKYDRSSLKCLGSVGEPINHEAWEWYHEVVGEKRCPIADTWWQTETGAISISPLPCDKHAEIKPAMAMRPFFGINAVLLDEKGEELELMNAKGVLCIKSPWPGLAATIYGDHKRFIETYLKPYPGYYFTGDGAAVDQEGHFKITGRIDDVINVSGHRIGTAEVENILDEHPAVAETAVVGFPHEVLGEALYAFVTVKENLFISEEELVDELKATVRKSISSYAIPQHFLITPNLPKTRSGKIMRRILRAIANNKPISEMGDITTLADPEIVQAIFNKHAEITKKSKK